ncbi:hypothetical protein PD653_1915 [Nocardioides sp. PD653]|nr:hypothetical protein PD653B2_1185 [Nocardioides sp. PD653-B2]GAW54507.1 hypothetical protein PD653_1915 [Nocardioides sp. PD653]
MPRLSFCAAAPCRASEKDRVCDFVNLITKWRGTQLTTPAGPPHAGVSNPATDLETQADLRI